MFDKDFRDGLLNAVMQYRQFFDEHNLEPPTQLINTDAGLAIAKNMQIEYTAFSSVDTEKSITDNIICGIRFCREHELNNYKRSNVSINGTELYFKV